MELKYAYLRVVRDGTNLSWVKTRGFDGYLVSMHQSGTHWLLNMLTLAMAAHYQLEVPRYIQNCHVIGSPKRPTHYADIPSLVRSHQIPNPLFTGRLVQGLLRMPSYVLLLRDPRVVLASHYKRFETLYKIDFPDYLRCRLDKMQERQGARKFDKDIWWDMRFLNSWDRLKRARPEAVQIVRYEDLSARTFETLRQTADWLGLAAIDDATLNRAAAHSSKSEMAEREDPSWPSRIVRTDDGNPLSLYSDADKIYFLERYRRNCHADFGYDLEAGW